MMTSSLPTLTATSPQTLVDSRRQSRSPSEEANSSFAKLLARRANASDPAAHEAEVRKGVEELVSAVLVQPILKQLHESNHAAAPFAPTSAEKQFQSMMDGKLALDFTRRAKFPLVESVTQYVLHPPHKGPVQAPTSAALPQSEAPPSATPPTATTGA